VKGHTDARHSTKLRLVRHLCRTCRGSVYNELFDDDGRLERRVSRPSHTLDSHPRPDLNLLLRPFSEARPEGGFALLSACTSDMFVRLAFSLL